MLTEKATTVLCLLRTPGNAMDLYQCHVSLRWLLHRLHRRLQLQPMPHFRPQKQVAGPIHIAQTTPWSSVLRRALARRWWWRWRHLWLGAGGGVPTTTIMDPTLEVTNLTPTPLSLNSKELPRQCQKRTWSSLQILTFLTGCGNAMLISGTMHSDHS